MMQKKHHWSQLVNLTKPCFNHPSLIFLDFWNSLDLYIGLVIACLPSLRPYYNLAAESRAFTYIRNKTSDRGSRCTGTGSIRSSQGFKLSSKPIGESFVTPAGRLSQSSLPYMDPESRN